MLAWRRWRGYWRAIKNPIRQEQAVATQAVFNDFYVKDLGLADRKSVV